ncbi:MAG: hypothetical protein AAGA48_06950 [Myxococcota bacterium]
MLPLVVVLSSFAEAADPEGIPVTVRVVDENRNPISTAVVRHPEEKDRHRVNAKTGEWTDRVLYLPDGRELFFVKGLRLDLEVSAPGYRTERVVYEVRKRRNVFEVPLEALKIDASQDTVEDVEVLMPRPRPLDK